MIIRKGMERSIGNQICKSNLKYLYRNNGSLIYEGEYKAKMKNGWGTIYS